MHTSSGSPIALRFPGQWFQSESGLHQNWMRDYDPTTGRYIQADPLGLVDGASVYGYARQSPGRYSDKTGLCPICPFIPYIAGGAGAVGAGAGTASGAGVAIGAGILYMGSTTGAGDGTIPLPLVGDDNQCKGTDCEKLYQDDLDVCRALGRTGHRRAQAAKCYGLAEIRRFECKRDGFPTTPLNVWY